MDNQKLEKELSEMKSEYERLPDFTTDGEILKLVKEKNKKRFNWYRLGTYVAGLAAAVLLISLLSVSFIQEKDPADQESDELKSFFNEKKREFQTSLGVEEVETFTQIEDANKLIIEYQKGLLDTDLDKVKETISNKLLTPKQKMKSELNKINQYQLQPQQVDTQIKDIIDKQQEFIVSMQNYWGPYGNQLMEQLPEDYFTYNRVENLIYDAKIDQSIIHAINVVKNQGYNLIYNGHTVGVAIDYHGLLFKFKDDISLEMQDYLKMAQQVYPIITDNYTESEWEQIDDKIIEIEQYIIKHPQSDMVNRSQLYERLQFYISQYFTAENALDFKLTDNNGIIKPKYQSEFQTFLDNNKQSKLWDPLNNWVNYLKENNWHLIPYQVNLNLQEQLDPNYQPPATEPQTTSILPIDGELKSIYKQYRSRHQDPMLNGLSAFDTVKLYLQALNDGDYDTAYQLLWKGEGSAFPSEVNYVNAITQNNNLASLLSILSIKEVLTMENSSGDKVSFEFSVDGNSNPVITLRQTDSGVWKVIYN